MVKTLKNLLLQNRQADFHETWYVASGTPAHHSLYITDDPGVTLTYFTARSNFVTLALLLEKEKKVDYSETIAACDHKLMYLMKIYEY